MTFFLGSFLRGLGSAALLTTAFSSSFAADGCEDSQLHPYRLHEMASLPTDGVVPFRESTRGDWPAPMALEVLTTPAPLVDSGAGGGLQLNTPSGVSSTVPLSLDSPSSGVEMVSLGAGRGGDAVVMVGNVSGNGIEPSLNWVSGYNGVGLTPDLTRWQIAAGIGLPLALVYGTRAEGNLLVTNLFAWIPQSVVDGMPDSTFNATLTLADAAFYDASSWAVPYVLLKHNEQGRLLAAPRTHFPNTLHSREYLGLKRSMFLARIGGSLVLAAIPIFILHDYWSNGASGGQLSDYKEFLAQLAWFGVSRFVINFSSLGKVTEKASLYLSRGRTPAVRTARGAAVEELEKACSKLARLQADEEIERAWNDLMTAGVLTEPFDPNNLTHRKIRDNAQLKLLRTWGRAYVVPEDTLAKSSRAYILYAARKYSPYVLTMALMPSTLYGGGLMGWSSLKSFGRAVGIANAGLLTTLGTAGGIGGSAATTALTAISAPQAFGRVLDSTMPHATSSYWGYQMTNGFLSTIQGAIFAVPEVVLFYLLLNPSVIHALVSAYGGADAPAPSFNDTYTGNGTYVTPDFSGNFSGSGNYTDTGTPEFTSGEMGPLLDMNLLGWVIPFWVAKTTQYGWGFFETLAAVPSHMVDGFYFARQKVYSCFGKEAAPYELSFKRKKDEMVKLTRAKINLLKGLPDQTMQEYETYDREDPESGVPVVLEEPESLKTVIWQDIKGVSSKIGGLFRSLKSKCCGGR